MKVEAPEEGGEPAPAGPRTPGRAPPGPAGPASPVCLILRLYHRHIQLLHPIRGGAKPGGREKRHLPTPSLSLGLPPPPPDP